VVKKPNATGFDVFEALRTEKCEDVREGLTLFLDDLQGEIAQKKKTRTKREEKRR